MVATNIDSVLDGTKQLTERTVRQPTGDGFAYRPPAGRASARWPALHSRKTRLTSFQDTHRQNA
eukprot:scaffold282028_cov16-Prasinocladus_malaysianus.AAC.1